MSQVRLPTAGITDRELPQHILNLIGDLSNRRPEIRHRAVRELRANVAAELREMSAEAGSAFFTSFQTRIFNVLMRNEDPHSRLCSIELIDELIDMKLEFQETATSRFANYFRFVVQQETNEQVLEAIARSLGHLARAGGALTVDTSQFFIRESLEWLRANESPPKRLAAVLILKELAQHTPTLFNQHIHEFLTLVWAALKDPSEHTRVKAIEALRVCLFGISKRESVWRNNCFSSIFKAASSVFTSKPQSPSHCIHGALLVLGELLTHTGEFMYSRIIEACEHVFAHRDSKNARIAMCVIWLMPRLACLSPDAFVRKYLPSAVTYLIKELKGQNREIAFLSLGEMASAVGDHLVHWLPQILAEVQAGMYITLLTPLSSLSFSLPLILALLTSSPPPTSPHPLPPLPFLSPFLPFQVYLKSHVGKS